MVEGAVLDGVVLHVVHSLGADTKRPMAATPSLDPARAATLLSRSQQKMFRQATLLLPMSTELSRYRTLPPLSPSQRTQARLLHGEETRLLMAPLLLLLPPLLLPPPNLHILL